MCAVQSLFELGDVFPLRNQFGEGKDIDIDSGTGTEIPPFGRGKCHFGMVKCIWFRILTK